LSSDEVQAEIRIAGRCTVAGDCVDIGSFCPYGCSIVVHKDEAERMRQFLAGQAKNSCLYRCAPLKAIACEAGQCRAEF
jgi:hypothetical protein